MNSSSSFLAGILWTSLLAPSVAAFPQEQNYQAALAKQSSIIFSGTVSQLGAASFAGVPTSPQTIVVRVDSVLKKPPAVSLKKGDNVTVEMKDLSGFQQATQAMFYTDGWIFGSGVAVKELGHEIIPSGAASAGASERARSEIQKQSSDQELQDRVASADYVVVGRIIEVRPWTVPKSAAAPRHITEHDPDWHEAVLEIQSVLKGTKVKKNKLVVRFPGCIDVAWAQSPKFQKHQQGVFFLKKDAVSGVPMTLLGGAKGDTYTCLKSGDWLPLSAEAPPRPLAKN